MAIAPNSWVLGRGLVARDATDVTGGSGVKAYCAGDVSGVVSRVIGGEA